MRPLLLRCCSASAARIDHLLLRLGGHVQRLRRASASTAWEKPHTCLSNLVHSVLEALLGIRRQLCGCVGFQAGSVRSRRRRPTRKPRKSVPQPTVCIEGHARSGTHMFDLVHCAFFAGLGYLLHLLLNLCGWQRMKTGGRESQNCTFLAALEACAFRSSGFMLLVV